MRSSSFISFFIFILILIPQINIGQIAPNLGTASGFALFTAIGAFDNTGTTSVTGDIGTNVGAFSFTGGTLINGIIHVADGTSGTAAVDVASAYAALNQGGIVLGVGLGAGQILGPGVYQTGGASTLNGILTLDGGGNSGALFIIRIVGGALSAGVNSTVNLINGATLNHVYWQVGGAFSLGDNSVFRGTLIADGELNIYAGSSILGRGLSKAGAIHLFSNTVIIGLTPAAIAGTDRTICKNENTQIGAAAVPGSSYEWSSAPAGFTSTESNPTVTPLVTTTYTLTETITTTGVPNSNSVLVTVNPSPVTSLIYHF